MSNGKFEIRPSGAAPLFSPGEDGTGRAMARRRWDKEKESMERAVVLAVQELTGEELSFEAAADYAIRQPLVKKALAGHVAAIKLVLQQLDRLRGGAAETQVDARQVHMHIYQLGRPEALRLAEDLREAGKMAHAALIESQIGDGEGPFEVQVPIE